MWRGWLGPKARIIGIDLNPECAKWRDSGFEIFIGDQGDSAFMRQTLDSIGEFDALLDDGGHQSFQQIVTLQEAIQGYNRPCVIAVEDTATSYMRDFANHGSRSVLNYAKASTDLLVGRSFGMAPDRYPPTHNEEAVDFFKSVFSIEPDFRYRGRSSAVVSWSSLLSSETVSVEGGLLK